jgi:hypothetical protein
VDPVNPGRRENDGGVPRSHERLVAPPGSPTTAEDYRGANDAKAEKLRRNTLQRRASALGLELRHSEYGYALIDSTRRRVEDRGDMTLDEIESRLLRG